MFIIKKHYEATETNKNFAGEVRDYYEGKGGHTLGHDDFPCQWEINNYGYTTKSGAARGLKAAIELAEWETKQGHWTVTAELIEVNV